MTASQTPENPGGMRGTLRTFLKTDLPEDSELSWLCETHRDPEAMRLVLRSRYVCAHCTRGPETPAV
ncbi:hypothetical protein GCM10010387_67820 [Streptomyces inusitatus]|uniref:Uncharacterized protein n=1 Tax=Streptomyces inusitatus TaxID=68221 RepID=A0A918V3Z3_9ACTN|nr:hypothetical protein GCM10010387_67820 [Streptomyces inusitatus]